VLDELERKRNSGRFELARLFSLTVPCLRTRGN
jgi:hypothetical protein